MNSNNSGEPNRCKVPSHQQKLVQYFCLDELCFNKRLFCQSCAKLDHKKHRIGRIDRLIEPLSLLNINSFHEDSSKIYADLKSKISDFYQTINDLKKSFQSTVQQLETATIFQVKSILSTFSNEKIQEIETLFLSENPNQEDVKTAIEMINFLQFDFVQDSYTVKNVADILLSKMINIVQKTTNKISTIFDKLIKNFKENDFISELKLYNLNLENSARKKFEEGEFQSKCKLENENKIETAHELASVGQKMKCSLDQQRSTLPINHIKMLNKHRAFFEESDTKEILNMKQERKERNIIIENNY